MPQPLKGSGSFSSRAQIDAMLQVTRTFNTAQMTALAGTPQEIVRAPGSGKSIILLAASIIVHSTGHTPYATGSNLILGNATQPNIISFAGSLVHAATNDLEMLIAVSGLGGALAGFQNIALEMTVDGINYTNGTGTNVDVTAFYAIQ